MPAGTLLTVLSSIPWGQMVDNAPKVAEGAVKLWNAVARRGRADPPARGAAAAGAGQPASELEVLQARVLGLEGSVQNLQDQMQASSELIKALAEQNAQLVHRIELHRVRLLRVAVAATALGLALTVALVVLWVSRH